MPRETSPDSVAMFSSSSTSTKPTVATTPFKKKAVTPGEASAGKWYQGKALGRTSRYRGVTKAGKNRWKARICYGGAKNYIGTYNNEEQAARAYDVEAAKTYGPHCELNFPPKGHTVIKQGGGGGSAKKKPRKKKAAKKDGGGSGSGGGGKVTKKRKGRGGGGAGGGRAKPKAAKRTKLAEAIAGASPPRGNLGALALLALGPSASVGARVSVYDKANREWEDARITKANQTGTYDVAYADGAVAGNVSPKKIKFMFQQPQ